MKLDDVQESSNVDDRRRIRIGRGGALGVGGVVVAVVLTLLGAPKELVQSVLQGGGTTTGQEQEVPVDPAQAPAVTRIKRVLKTTEITWDAIFRANGRQYEPPTLVLFTDAVASACGQASSAVGPFYCPNDHKVYLDLNFFSELDRRFGAPGDFAQGYVVAHEVGHHIQSLTGISETNQSARSRGSQADSNRLSVRLELQADCYAGIWGRRGLAMSNKLELGDIEEGLTAASAIGDDTLQKRARGTVVSESFTHGSSEQRVKWFKRGFDTGRVESCDTSGNVDL